MSDFPPTADFFAPHVAASAYRGDSWVSSNADRPAADAPMNACGPVPPPAKASSQTDTSGDVEPLDDLCTVCGMREMTLEGHDGMCEVCIADEQANAYVDELIARGIPPF